MLQTTIRGVQTVDTTEYRLYVIKNETKETLYVGQSVNIKSRISQHMTSKTLIGAALSTNRPQSREWEVDLYTVNECTDIIKRYFPYAPKTSKSELYTDTRSMADFAEDALIHDLMPRYNLDTNIGLHWDLPFNKRMVHPEVQAYLQAQQEAKEKSLAEQKRKYEEHQALLASTPCTICGEHDKWVRCINDTPCGVLDYKSVYDGNTWVKIPFVCHDCNSVINSLNDLHTKEETVRKVKRAIRKYRIVKKPAKPLTQYSQITLNFDSDSCA